MRRLAAICMAVCLTGCAVGEIASPAVKGPEDSQAEASLPEGQTVPERHLPLYGGFDHYNEHDYFHGFKVSEVLENGILYYQFTRDDADIRVLMDEEGETTVFLGDKTAAFSSAFMPAGGSTGMDWVDLTGDGNPEFVHSRFHNGTGFNPDDCLIFDGVTLEELPVEDFTEDVGTAFSEIAKVKVCGTECGVNEDGSLEACGVVILPDAPGPAWYFGEANGKLAWDESVQMFVLNGPMTAEVYEEAKE